LAAGKKKPSIKRGASPFTKKSEDRKGRMLGGEKHARPTWPGRARREERALPVNENTLPQCRRKGEPHKKTEPSPRRRQLGTPEGLTVSHPQVAGRGNGRFGRRS